MTPTSTSEEIRKIKAKPHVFCGGFDSDPVSLNGYVKRLHIYSYPELKNGEQINVVVKILELDRYFNRDGKTVDESSDDDVIATFEGVLHNKNEKFFFSNMRPSKPINWSEKAPYPWFRLAFERENDCVTGKCDNTTDTETFPVVLGKNDEPPESPEFERHVDSIAILHRNRNYIIEMTERAIRGIDIGTITDATSYLKFLEDLKNVNAAAEFFAHIRALHAIAKGSKDAYDVTLEAMDDVKMLLGFEQIPGVEKFDSQIVKNIRTLFSMMREMDFEIDKIIIKTTSEFINISSIFNHFNKALVHYDMFGVNHNADIRHQNTLEEMLLAIDEICDLWAAQKRARDNWVKEMKSKYIHHSIFHLQREWARRTKIFDTSLEIRIANFKSKVEGQIEAREALGGESSLNFLNSTTREITVLGTNLIYDFDDESFRIDGTELIEKYF